MKAAAGRGGTPASWALPALLAATVLIIPFLHSGKTVDFDLAPKFLAMAVIVLGLQLRLCLRRRGREAGRSPIPSAAWVFTAFTAVSLLAILPAANPYEGFADWIKTAMMAMLLWQAMGIMADTGPESSRSMLAKAMGVFGLAAGCSALYGIHGLGAQAQTLDGLYLVTGTFGHKNLLSSILFLSSPFSLFLCLRSRGAWRLVGAFSLASGLAAILLLQTRSAWLAVAMAALAGGGLAWIGRRATAPSDMPARPVKRKGTLGATAGSLAILCVLVGALVAVFGLPKGLGQRAASAFDPAKNSWRTLIWKKSLLMAKERPWLGVGPGNWKIEFPRFGTDDIRVVGGEREGTETEFIRPHNDFIWVLCETGIVGGFLYAGFFLAVLGACIRSRIRSPDPDARAYAICVFAGMTGYMVDAFFSFPRERIAHSVFLILMAASMLAFPEGRPERAGAKTGTGMGEGGKGRNFKWRTLGKWAGLVLAASAVLSAWMRLEAEKSMRLALQARAEGRWEDVITATGKVDTRAYPLDPFGNPVSFYAGTGYFMLGQRERAKSAFEDALRSHPFHAHILNNLGTCMELSGEPAKAIVLFERAFDIRPAMEDPWLNGASMYYNQGDAARARQWLSWRPPQPGNPRWKRLSDLLDSLERAK